MKIAWQTVVVGALGFGEYVVSLVAGNESVLGINAPWLTLVIIPAVATGFLIAANQLKAIGSDTPPGQPPTAAQPQSQAKPAP